MKSNYYTLNLTELSKCILTENIKVVDIVDSFITRYDEIEKYVFAWADYDKDLFLKQAVKLDKKISNNEYFKEDLLLGIPIGIKDTYNTEFFKTQRGSDIYTNYKAGNDARIVRKARDFGAIITGKTSSAEFSIHAPSKTKNPYNKEHTPGTSSGGSAVAVATGMVPVALGTQTAASTSKPASYCGVYGFKPTFGLLPRTGVLKTCDTLDTLSFFSRSIEDIEVLFETLRLRGDDHPFINLSLDQEVKYLNIKKKKIAFFKSSVFELKPDYAKKAFYNLAKEIEEKLNIIVEVIETPNFLEPIRNDHEKIYSKSVSYYFDYEYKNHKSSMNKLTIDMIEYGKEISKSEYKQLLITQAKLTEQFKEWFSHRYDFAITLASAEVAPKGLEYNDKLDSTLIWTYLGLPTLIAPKFIGPDNMPFGFQIVSSKYNDKKLIEFGKLLKHHNIIKNSKVVGVR